MHTFQIRSIGTQTIKLNATLPAADVHTIANNYQHIFRLGNYVATVRPDGQFDVQVTLEPDNGIVTVDNSTPASKHHRPNEEHAEPEQHNGDSDAINA